SKIEKIQRFDNKNQLVNEENFSWEKINGISKLTSKAFLNGNKKIIFIKKFFYDKRCNLVEERLYGNITGKTFNLELNEKKLDGVNSEYSAVKYEYTNDKRNLLIKIIDENKVETIFSYLPGTNILSSKFIVFNDKIKNRCFYEYNQDNILIKEFEDDGTSFDKNDIKNINFRTIREYSLKQSEPFLGLVESVESKYLDLNSNTEKLLQKEEYTYSNQAKVIRKEISDSNNGLAYYIDYEHDQKGNIVSQTDSLNKKTKYRYDDDNNLISTTFPNGKVEENSYNLCNKLIKKTIKRNLELQSYKYVYDKTKNCISYTDLLGNESIFEYDNFSNLITEKTPKLANDKKSFSIIMNRYDSDGSIIEVKENQNITKTINNIFSKPILIYYPDGSEEQYQYNLDGTIKAFLDKEGKETQYEYDYLKRIVSKKIFKEKKLINEELYKYNSFDISYKKTKDGEIFYFYDNAKRLISEKRTSQNQSFQTQYFYDDLSNNYKTIYENTICEIKKKDFFNRNVLEEKQDINGTILYQKSYEYDEFDNLTIVSYIDGKESREKYFYDCLGRVIKIINPLEEETIYKYENARINDYNLIKKTTISLSNCIEEDLMDFDGREYQVEKKNDKDQLLSKINYQYDLFDNLIYVKNLKYSNDIIDKSETFNSYDNMNQLISQKNNDSKNNVAFNFEYTKNGLLKSVHNSDGISVNREYDNFGNVIKLFTTDGLCSYEFKYNNFDLPIEIVDLVNHKNISRKYDAFKNLIEEEIFNGLVIKNRYDKFNRKIATVFPDKSSIEYVYNPVFLQKVIRKDPFGNVLYSQSYLLHDLSGNSLKEELLADVGIIKYSKDILGKSLFFDSRFGVEKELKYDLLGKTEQIKSNLFGKSTDLSSRYDFNMTQSCESNIKAKEPADNSAYFQGHKNNLKCFYDSLGRLVKMQKDEYQYEFIFDGLDRVVTKNIYEVQNGIKQIAQINYFYDGFEKIGFQEDISNIYEVKIPGINDNTIAYEIRKEIYVPISEANGNINYFVCLNQSLVEANKYKIVEKSQISALVNEMRFDIHINPYQNLMFNNFFRHIDIAKVGSVSFFDKKVLKEEITDFEIRLDDPFSYFKKMILPEKPIEEMGNLKFTKDALDMMEQYFITAEDVVEAVKRPGSIEKIGEGMFFVIYNDIKILVDVKNKVIKKIEKTN
ncbi:MAG: RHS repeat domain-containing protein, partial [Parachlamydiales bacterium]